MGDFELLSLLLHLLKEDLEILWDLVIANEVLHIIPGVEFLAQILAHLVYGRNRLWEFHVWLICIVESNWSQDLKFLFCPLCIELLLILTELNTIIILSVGDSIEVC